MRSTEDRLFAVKRRAREIEQERKIRHGTIISLTSIFFCLSLIIGLSLAMPSIMASMPEGEHIFYNTSASIFEDSSSFGYVLIGLLAFLLGISVTILSYRIHLRNKSYLEDKEDCDG